MNSPVTNVPDSFKFFEIYKSKGYSNMKTGIKKTRDFITNDFMAKIENIQILTAFLRNKKPML